MVAQGWCPSTYRIYDAPDGGLARVKVPGGILSTTQVAAVAAAARQFGNGTIDITSRANLQLRGIDSADAADLRTKLGAVALSAPTAEMEDRRNVVASPTAGLVASRDDNADDEVLDVRPSVIAAVRGLDGLDRVSGLTHKFGVLIDGGGDPTLRAIALDLSLGAGRIAERDEVVFSVALGEALDVADGDVVLAATPDAVESVVAAAARLCAAPPHGIAPGRMVDVVRALGLGKALAELSRTAPIATVDPPRVVPRTRPLASAPLGVHGDGGAGRAWVGVRGREATLTAGHFAALADMAKALGATDVRLTPWRSVIVAELSAPAAIEMVASLARSGWTDAPRDTPPDAPADTSVEARTRSRTMA